MLLPLLLALHLEPTDLRLVEPLRLTSGLEVEAVYYEPTDSFCLGFTDFLMARADIEGAVTTIEEERRIAGERVRVCVSKTARRPPRRSWIAPPSWTHR